MNNTLNMESINKSFDKYAKLSRFGRFIHDIRWYYIPKTLFSIQNMLRDIRKTYKIEEK